MVWKFDLLQIGQFNKFLDPLFEGIMNMFTKMSDCACGTCYTQNSDWDRRSRLGDLLQLIWFKVVPDPNLEGILNLEWEIWNSYCVSQYSTIGDSGRRSRWGDLLQLISFKVVSRSKFRGSSESEEGNLKFSLCVPIFHNWWFRQEEHVKWPFPIDFVQNCSRTKFGGEQEYGHRIFISGL